MSFMQGYLTVMNTQQQDIKKHMNSHLQEDGEAYGWPVANAFNATWLQHIEMGRAIWDNQNTKLKLRLAFMWHQVDPTPHAWIASHPLYREATTLTLPPSQRHHKNFQPYSQSR